MYSLSQEDGLIRKACDYCLSLISIRDLKEYAFLNITILLSSDRKDIAALIHEIEGSVVEIDEGLLTEEEFRGNLEKILTPFQQTLCAWTSVSTSQTKLLPISWESNTCYHMTHAFTQLSTEKSLLAAP